MKLRQLQCLCALVDAGFNISRAAVALHATQPAVSKQLIQFEQELGVDLILRQAGRLVGLTEAGEQTLLMARRALRCTEGIRSLAREGAEAGGSIIIATSHAHANYVLLPVILEFTKRYPQIHVSVLQGTPVQTAELVREGRVAFGITHLPESLPQEVAAVKFLTSNRLLVMPVGHPLRKERTLTLEKIGAFPLVLQHSSRPHGARIVKRFREAGIDVNVVMQALDADVIKTYVEAGLGVGIIPAFAFQDRKDRGLHARDVGHLFDPSDSAVLLRRYARMQKHIYQFLSQLDASLDSDRIDEIVFDEIQARHQEEANR